MTSPKMLSKYVGFTQDEVMTLCNKNMYNMYKYTSKCRKKWASIYKKFININKIID
jgi:hypothetical protein